MSDPTISESFNARSGTVTYSREDSDPNILAVCYTQRSMLHFYDFSLRILTTRYDHSIAVTPFSQLDQESLIGLRDKLKELNGAPPPLPAPPREPDAKGSLKL